MLLVSLGEGQDTGIMTYGATTKGLDMKLQHKSELEDKGKCLLFKDITDHHLVKESKSIYEVFSIGKVGLSLSLVSPCQ